MIDDPALPEALAELAAARADEMDADTVNRELSIARKAMGWWQRQGWIDCEPTIGIERRPAPPDRTKALAENQITERGAVPERGRPVPAGQTREDHREGRGHGVDPLAVWHRPTPASPHRPRTRGPLFLTDGKAPAGTPTLDVCPETGRARLSYRRAEEISEDLKNCSASEVAAMIEGVLRHCTEMVVDRQYTDTHGASIVGFAFAHMLGFNLLPRLKNVGSARLYRPAAGEGETWPHLVPVLSSKTIDWELIRQQYDQIVKYTTALRLGTAEAEQVLRRFTRGGPKHPTYRAIEDWGGRCGRRSSATTWPTRSCGGRSTRACRWWRTGTPPTTTCSTARTGI